MAHCPASLPSRVALLPEGTALLHVSIQVHVYRDVLAHMLPMLPGHSRHLAAHAAFPIVNIIPAPGPVRYWDLLSQTRVRGMADGGHQLHHSQ